LEAGGKLIRFGLNVLLDECRIWEDEPRYFAKEFSKKNVEHTFWFLLSAFSEFEEERAMLKEILCLN
jgi:hypothetical protein